MIEMEEELLGISEGYTFQKHVAKTFAWMAIGLFISYFSAKVFLSTGLVGFVFDYTMVLIFFVVLELIVSFKFFKTLGSESYSTTLKHYVIYCVVTGITFTLVGMSFAFFSAVIYFGVLALIATYTKFDLTKFKNVLIVSVIVIIALELIGYFILEFHPIYLSIGFIGLFEFSGITLYDIKMMRVNYEKADGDFTKLKQYSLYSAFRLMIDFLIITIFLALTSDSNRSGD